ncbi:Cytochrome b561 [Marinobacter daqiaonensis]|uniref:Cytochrome b561 n=1 Tax=Marinobacter daqiaonensis TaxID=650891 RepID=A0A1I6IAJ2_9GAMM|nr:cytochrome b/b6 domain-containing protein [Marinobacter daqiaonensis]SFR63782.1 Cytochrome b561 [Marinobacter daqiaonensis]
MSDRNRYSSVSTINHWVTALLVVVMLALGFAAAAAPSETVENYVLGVHISLGFFVLIFIIWRVLFRIYEGFPRNVGKTALERWAAYAAHRLILILLTIQVITGPMYLFTENECMNVFGWFSLCLPLESLSMIHEPMEWLHLNIGLYVLPVLLVLHFIGAIRHYATNSPQETPADM